MSRPAKVLVLFAVAAIAAGCGTEKVTLSSSNPLHRGAVLFNQRCGGCHTFSYAATHGSAANVRTAQYNNGPNFDIRCERPVDRVLYAIENGGFSGAIMPQNVVVGQDAIEVAKFVATYAGSKAPHVSGVEPCNQQPVGTLPANIQGSAAAPSRTATAAAGAGARTKKRKKPTPS